MAEMKNPLVSIIVITYNSSKFVLETLNSAKEQTYENIELIVSDDFSTDNTTEICRKWIEENKERFIGTKLVTTDHNTGISANCNRGVKAAKGEWVKLIAGDDILNIEAIERFIEYSKTNRNAKIINSRMMLFDNDFDFNKLYPYKYDLIYLFYVFSNARKQHKILTKIFQGGGPTNLISKSILEEVNGFDERFPMHEDYPLFIKLTGRGYKIHFMDSVTVFRRVHEKAISRSKLKDAFFSEHEIRSIVDYKYAYKRDYLNKLWQVLLTISIFMQKLVIVHGNTRMKMSNQFLFAIYRIFDPFVLYGRKVKIVEKLIKYLVHNNILKWRKF